MTGTSFRTHCQLLASLLCMFGLGLAAFPAEGQFHAAPGKEYREFHSPVNPVRGEAIVGIAVAPSEAAQRERSVRVFIAQPFSGEIRVETATADGRFRGEGTYVGSTNGNEWVTLELASPPATGGKPAPNRPVGEKSLSLSARGPAGELFVSRWGSDAPGGPQEKVRFYVNSRRADMFVRAGSRIIPCTNNGVPQPVRFDAYCDVVLSDIPKDGRLTLIRREMMDEQAQAIKLVWR